MLDTIVHLHHRLYMGCHMMMLYECVRVVEDAIFDMEIGEVTDIEGINFNTDEDIKKK